MARAASLLPLHCRDGDGVLLLAPSSKIAVALRFDQTPALEKAETDDVFVVQQVAKREVHVYAVAFQRHQARIIRIVDHLVVARLVSRIV